MCGIILIFVQSIFRMTVRSALESDLRQITAVLDAAKGIMRADGNDRQWVDGYPSEAVILEDIRQGYGHVVLENSRVVGYFAFIPSPEPTYAQIYDGAWLEDERPYHVVHRIGSLPEVHGVFRTVMDWCFAHDANIRIDTHRDNRIMQHNIRKYGFRYCGIIYLASGDERLAYQLRRIEVVAAIIRRDDKIFATQRGYGEWKDWWEFPGGKMESGETPQEALTREIREELDAEIRIGRLLHTVEWDYPKFHLTMHCYLCFLAQEALHLLEHESARWLDAASLGDVRWLPADEGLLPLIRAELDHSS